MRQYLKQVEIQNLRSMVKVTNLVLGKLLSCFECLYFEPILKLIYTNIKYDDIWIKCAFHRFKSKVKVTDAFRKNFVMNVALFVNLF